MKNWQLRHIKKALKIRAVKGLDDTHEVVFTHSYRFGQEVLSAPDYLVQKIRVMAGEEIRRVTETVKIILECTSEKELEVKLLKFNQPTN